MKFSQVARGTRAEREVAFPQPEGEPVRLAVRPLTGAEEAEVLARTLDFARGKGLESPKEGDPLFDLGIMVHTLAIGCVDVDSPSERRAPFFDGGAPQVLEHLHRETIAYLFERHQAWQDECSPYARKMDAAALLEATARIARDEQDFFFTRLSPALRLSWARTTARQLLSLLGLKSLYGSPSAEDGPSSKSVPETTSDVIEGPAE